MQIEKYLRDPCFGSVSSKLQIISTGWLFSIIKEIVVVFRNYIMMVFLVMFKRKSSCLLKIYPVTFTCKNNMISGIHFKKKTQKDTS